MAKIFISYRREDSQHQADRLHAALARKIPKRNIFIDVDNIPVGVDFVQHLNQQVGQCGVLLALIGPDWLEVKNPQTGQRRLDDPKDFVRIEIAAALKRGIPVAPVLLDGAPFPPEHRLPEDLKALTLRNGVEVRRLTFDADVERLVRGLQARPGKVRLPWKRKPASLATSAPYVLAPEPEVTSIQDQSSSTPLSGGNAAETHGSGVVSPPPDVSDALTASLTIPPPPAPEAPGKRIWQVTGFVALVAIATTAAGWGLTLMANGLSPAAETALPVETQTRTRPVTLLDRTGRQVGLLKDSIPLFDGAPEAQTALKLWWAESDLQQVVLEEEASAQWTMTVDLPVQTALVSALTEAFGSDEALAQAFAIAIDNSDGTVHAGAWLDRQQATEGSDQGVPDPEQTGKERTPWIVGDLARPLGFIKAFEEGMTSSTVRLDEPTKLGTWTPQNSQGEYRGAVTLTEALAWHLNTVAAQVLTEIGPDKLSEIPVLAACFDPPAPPQGMIYALLYECRMDGGTLAATYAAIVGGRPYGAPQWKIPTRTSPAGDGSRAVDSKIATDLLQIMSRHRAPSQKLDGHETASFDSRSADEAEASTVLLSPDMTVLVLLRHSVAEKGSVNPATPIAEKIMRVALKDRAPAVPAWRWVEEEAPRTNYVALNKITLENLEFMSAAIGRAHAVRTRCNGKDDQYWRAYQVDFLNLFANLSTANKVVRAPMVKAFNDSYLDASDEFAACSTALAQVEREAAKRIRDLVKALKPAEHGSDQASLLRRLDAAAAKVSAAN